ncbi:B12-binding domain-containing radical SAM protein [Carboxylicivirga taeanensis]|uniref:B12-binding domain-containing radical SAM protein n=1 Tax=Carboxylicivirga taeanensis TaxID=1416875 RepID=UPI003F6DA77E
MILLLTPPFTQLNTPYPATAYLKGYLNSLKLQSVQVDLGIEVFNTLFTKGGLTQLFKQIDDEQSLSPNAQRIYLLKEAYVNSVERALGFLRQPTTVEAQNICHGNILPEAARFNQLEEDTDAFGTMGLLDKAKHYCTLFLEDLSDFIVETVDANFGFSRYAERLGRAASSFDAIQAHLEKRCTFIEQILVDELARQVHQHQPELVLISIPFPGNITGALRIGQWLKQNSPDVRVVLGGGYVNTELREVTDARLFKFCDYVTLDDGELPVKCIVEHLQGQRTLASLKRTFVLQNGHVCFMNGATEQDILQKNLSTPDYSDVAWGKYISVVEVANPMFRLWSDGQWLKLTLAHGCYWGKCTFCDGSLDYIKRYEPSPVTMIVDRMEALMEQTGLRGFHFVDEAAPPVLLKDLALEIIRRDLQLVWWTNIRFEKSFTSDLCLLLKQSGCIAIAGGLEVASPRVLKLINKGVTLEQVTNVTANLTGAGIMVHAYLMYGFPTQTDQETIDSLEVVRQLFSLGVIESGFWHQFALTAHSPVGLNAQQYNVCITGGLDGDFAKNDLDFMDLSGANHTRYGEGLKKALYNYMHGVGFDFPLSDWFEFRVPKTQLPPNYIQNLLSESLVLKSNSQVIWLSQAPVCKYFVRERGKKRLPMAELTLLGNKTHVVIEVKEQLGTWLCSYLKELSVASGKKVTLEEFQADYEASTKGSFDKFINSYTFSQLREAGLLIL